MRGRCCRSLLALVLTLLWPAWAMSHSAGTTAAPEQASAAVSSDVNTRCPVEPSEPASAEYEVTYRGKKVRFCCAGCMEEFQANPRPFLAGLPQFEQQAEELAGASDLESKPEASAAWAWLDAAFDRYGAVCLALLACGSLYGLSSRLNASSALGRFRRRLGRRRAFLSALLGLVLGAILMDVLTQDRMQGTTAEALAKIRDYEAAEQIHFATFHDYGYPPVPFKPPQPPALKRTYYRGNDERNPELFNGGLYRTTTFDVQLVDARGAPVEYGSTLAPRDLFIRLETIRGANTPSYFWTSTRMKRIFLTRRADKFLGRDKPVDDAVTMTTLEPMQRWEQSYPLDNFRMPAEPPLGHRSV